MEIACRPFGIRTWMDARDKRGSCQMPLVAFEGSLDDHCSAVTTAAHVRGRGAHGESLSNSDPDERASSRLVTVVAQPRANRSRSITPRRAALDRYAFACLLTLLSVAIAL